MNRKPEIIAVIILMFTLFYVIGATFFSNIGSEDIEEAKEEHNTVLVDFYSEGCKACRDIEPIIDEIEDECPEIEVLKVDINSEEGLHNKYDIHFLPTVIIYKDGEETNRYIGKMTKEQYIENL
jgi:thioredoxin 1